MTKRDPFEYTICSRCHLGDTNVTLDQGGARLMASIDRIDKYGPGKYVCINCERAESYERGKKFDEITKKNGGTTTDGVKPVLPEVRDALVTGKEVPGV